MGTDDTDDRYFGDTQRIDDFQRLDDSQRNLNAFSTFPQPSSTFPQRFLNFSSTLTEIKYVLFECDDKGVGEYVDVTDVLW